MTGRDDRTDEMIALEQARAQLEIGLSGDARWLALRHGASSGRDDGTNAERAAQLESALAGNPLYQSWKLVTEAIDLLRAKQRAQEAPGPGLGTDMGPGDDLTRIRGISLDLARRLAVLGVTHYSTIAAWRPVDVSTVAAALGLGRQISRQNWIEQAALLQRRAESSQAGAAPTTENLTAAEEPPSVQQAAPAQDQPAQQRQVDLPDILEAIRSDADANGAEPHPLASAAQSPAYTLHAADADLRTLRSMLKPWRDPSHPRATTRLTPLSPSMSRSPPSRHLPCGGQRFQPLRRRRAHRRRCGRAYAAARRRLAEWAGPPARRSPPRQQ